MLTAPTPQTASGLARWAWLPVPVLLAAMVGLWAADLRTSYESHSLVLGLNLVFATLASVAVALLIGRSFLAQPAPGMLLVGCGMLVWGVGSEVAAALASGGPNILITTHNLCAWLGACCLLGGVLLLRRTPPVARPGLWLGLAYAASLGVVVLIAHAAASGQIPLFFVQGQGGTLVRQFVLTSAIIMLFLAAAQLCILRPGVQSGFTYWYALALLLLALGLGGVMIQSVAGSLLGWTGRTAQYLGGAYMMVAALAWARRGGVPVLDLQTERERTWQRYLVAVALVLTATTVRLVFMPSLGLRVTFITFYPAVVLAALAGGLGPGLLATLLSALLANYFWMEPTGRLAAKDLADWLALGVFCGSGAMISFVTQAMHRAQRRAAVAEEAARHADERAQTEQALREALREKAFLAEVVERAAQPFAIGYPDGRIGMFNRAFEALTGYSAAELRSMDWANVLTPPEWRDLERLKLEEINRTGQPVRYEKEYLRKDGTRVAIELLVHLVRDAAGKPDYYYTFLTDITERKRTIDALRQSQARLEFALETTHTGAWDLDLGSHVAFRSHQHDRIFGYPELLPQWTYEMFLEHVLPEDRAEVDARFRQATATGGDWSFECRIRRADSQVRWIRAAGRHRPVAAGRPPLMAGIVQDITERMQAEEEIRRYTEQLQAANLSLQSSRKAALNLMTDAIEARQRADAANLELQNLSEQRRLAIEAADLGAWDYQFQTGQVVWDQRCRQMWGMPDAQQVDYSTAVSRIHPEDRAGVDAAVNEALTGRNAGSYHREYRVVWPDGSVHWIASHGRVYFEGEGPQHHPVRFIGANLEVTAERQAREALLESEERLAAFAAATFEGIVLSHRGVIVDCNEQLARMLGWTVQELIGRSLESLVAPEDVPRVADIIRAGRDTVSEHQVVRRDGTRITVETHGRPQRGHRGVRHTAVRDITRRKQREQLLEKLNRTLKALKDSSQAMMRATSEGEYLDEVCRILREDCGHALVWIGFAEQDDARSIRPIASAGFEQGYLQTLNLTWADTERGRGPTGTAIRTGYPALCKDMPTDPQFLPWREEALRRGYASSLVVPLLEEEPEAAPGSRRRAFGAISMYSHLPDAFTEDEVQLLTQLAEDVAYCIRVLRLRQARRRAERRTELLAETASRLLAAESPQQVVEELCREVLVFLDCQVFFNYLVDPPGGPTSAGRLHLNACGGIPAPEARRIEWLEYGTAVCGCVARDGACIVAEDIQRKPDPRAALVKSYGIQAYACHPLLTGAKVLGTLSFGTRTRTRFNPEELALMRAVTDLVAIAIERQRAKAALQQTAEELRRSNLDLEQFAYVASHDLQEPLRAVGGYVTLLQRRLGASLDARGREFVAGACEGAHRMERLIRDLLDFSRVGTRGGKFVPTCLEEPLQHALSNLGSSLQTSGAAVTHDPLPTLPIDAIQLMQVFQNLIGNALKFRGQQPPQIHIGASQQDGRWVVSVRDNGIGIAPQYYERIFQLFQRLHTRTEYPGTGIGLAICKRIIERHGGTIWVESQPGQGSTFYFSIPQT